MDYTLNIKGRLMSLSRPRVMGILNCTPDSFFAASRMQTEEAIAARANEIIGQGGDIIDVGACSTRPGGELASEEEEMRRLSMALPIVRHEQPRAVVSVDTFRPAVARMAVEEYGADIINDVSGGSDEMFDVMGQLRVPYILMSNAATIHDILMEFADKVQRLRDRHVSDIILDPGYGFGKTMSENFAVLHDQRKLTVMGLPLLIGLSRKRMVWQTLGISPDEALNGTTVLNTVALLNGADILRVHDVREAKQAAELIHNS